MIETIRAKLADTLFEQAQLLLQNGQQDEAVKKLQETIAIDQQHFLGHLVLARIFLDCGDLEAGAICAYRSHQISPCPDTHELICEVLARQALKIASKDSLAEDDWDNLVKTALAFRDFSESDRAAALLQFIEENDNGQSEAIRHQINVIRAADSGDLIAALDALQLLLWASPSHDACATLVLQLITSRFDSLDIEAIAEHAKPLEVLASNPTVISQLRELQDKTDAYVRPATRVAEVLPVRKLSRETIRDWLESDRYQKEQDYFRNYPRLSLLSQASRCFLYDTVRKLQPELVLEIGTYFAGTAELIARSLHDNGHGMLTTIDPFGGDRCRKIIQRWPGELRSRVSFSARSSMDYMMARSKAQPIDIAFINGNHDYEYVLFDLLTVAHSIRSDGIVILDNAEQIGVFQAAVTFLKLNPAWKELGDATQDMEASRPFSHTLERSSVPGTSFIVLQAPSLLTLAPNLPFSTKQIAYKSSSVASIRLEFASPPPEGTLHVECYLRSFGSAQPEEIKAISQHRLSPSAMHIEIPPGGPMHSEGSAFARTVEIALVWRPRDGSSSLQLISPPQPESGAAEA